MGSNLPSWEKLVLAMYFSLTSDQKLNGWSPFPNYLYAISEWYLSRQREPLEITARKLLKYFSQNRSLDNEKFIDSLHDNLYAPYRTASSFPAQAINKNKTLIAISELIRNGNDSSGIRTVVSYNYDNLLEMALDGFPYDTVYQQEASLSGGLPIYHVHGYVPFGQQDVAYQQDMIFTEDQYHRIGHDPYHWSNVVQLRSIAGTATLMIGLSLADRNMRRLLDAMTKAPIHKKVFAILPRAAYDRPLAKDLDHIHKVAISYLKEYQGSGVKSGRLGQGVLVKSNSSVKSSLPIQSVTSGEKKEAKYRTEIRGIMDAVHGLDQELADFVFGGLGVTPIWVDKFDEIPSILSQIRD